MVNFALVVLYILLPVALYEHCTIYTVLFVCHYITCIHNYRLFAHTMVLVSPAKPDTCTWERLWCQAYIWICRLGIYLVFMNILIHIHIANSQASVETTGGAAVVITYSAIWLDCTHGYSRTNLYIGLIPDPPPRVLVWGSDFARLGRSRARGQMQLG